MLGLVHSNIPAPEPIPPTVYIDHWPPGSFKEEELSWQVGKECRQDLTHILAIGPWKIGYGTVTGNRWFGSYVVLPVAQRATNVWACLRRICFVFWWTGSLERKWSMKSCGVTDARSHFNLFRVSSSICYKKKTDVRNETIELHKWLHIICSMLSTRGRYRTPRVIALHWPNRFRLPFEMYKKPNVLWCKLSFKLTTKLMQ